MELFKEIPKVPPIMAQKIQIFHLIHIKIINTGELLKNLFSKRVWRSLVGTGNIIICSHYFHKKIYIFSLSDFVIHDLLLLQLSDS